MKKQTVPLQGVNLGGWLVVEKWMTPSLFSGIPATNEYELSATAAGKLRLKHHHQNFITANDIAWLAGKGIEILRVPFGHWVFGEHPQYVGAIDRLDWVIDEANKHGMKVLLDLHGAPEAQNNKNHSGSGNRSRTLTWLKNKKAQEETIVVLERIARRYKHRTNVWGIELINEPACDLTGIRLAQFYRRAYRRLIQVARPGTHIIFSDGFHPLLLTNTFWLMRKKDYPAVLDTHIYHCFGKAAKKLNVQQHTTLAKYQHWLLRFLSFIQPVIVGEWSNVLPYPVSKNKNISFSRAQQLGFRASEATLYWSYKTESNGRWNFRDQVESGQLHILRPEDYNG